jgi:hypothetical protein
MKHHDARIDCFYRVKLVINIVLVGVAVERMFTIWPKQHFTVQERMHT